VEVREQPPAIGRGRSKRLAEQAAAERLLAHLTASGRVGEAAP
jgi:dsRNA-specific ribonuclease